MVDMFMRKMCGAARNDAASYGATPHRQDVMICPAWRLGSDIKLQVDVN